MRGVWLTLLGAVAVACATSTIDDTTDDDGGGASHAGGTGGAGGSVSPCATDCSAIDTPPCFTAVCNDGSHAGPVNQCVVVEDDGAACDDGLFCTTADSCLDGVCIGGPANDCGIDPPECQEVSCVEADDVCTTAPSANGGACTPDDLCLLGATCLNGSCSGGMINDCFFDPLPDECHVSVCNPNSGMCEPQVGNEGGPCQNQADLCSVGDSCTAGVCGGGVPKSCSHLTQGCVLGVCDATNGQCVAQNLVNGDPCDDLDPCTSGEVCMNGGCANGTPITACVGGDNCCPSSCNEINDVDCAVMPANYGNHVVFSDSSSHSPNYLLGSRITLPNAATLTHLAVITKGAGPSMKLALYGDASGNPSTLLASTPSTPMVLGTMEIAVANVFLPAGDYWFMAVFDQSASIGYDMSDPNAVVKYMSLTFSQPLPTVFPAPTTYNGQRFNYYIKVLE